MIVYVFHSARVLLCLMLLAYAALFSPIAASGCPNYAQEFSGSKRVYEGQLGGRYIRVALQYQMASGQLVGEYGYSHQPGVLRLMGEISSDGNRIDLTELTERGEVTGKFDLTFNVPSKPYIDQKHQADYNCQFLSGTWSSPDKRSSQAVNLVFDIRLHGIDDEDRQPNEKAAYAVQNALMKSNRKAFAALLNYPFFYYIDIRQNKKRVYKNPEEVMRDYRLIASIPMPQITDAVPHELYTTMGISSFMKGSMWLSKGKVVQICTGGCGLPYMDIH
jgi:hypothetical protein